MKPGMLMLFVTAILLISCNENSVETSHAELFYQQLTRGNGNWKSELKDSKSGFTAYIMEMKSINRDSLTGLIYGQQKNGDTVHFWKIVEFKDEGQNAYRTNQTGLIGQASYYSEFNSPVERQAEFELHYNNGTSHRIRDRHNFKNDSILQSESYVFDQQKEDWILQSSMEWKWMK